METMKETLHSILNRTWTGKVPKIVPINPPVVDIMKKAGVYWPEAHRKPDLMAGLSSACHELLGLNAVNVPFDMTVEAEALGCRTVWKDGITVTPQVVEGKGEQFDIDTSEDILGKGRFPVVLEAVRLLVEKYGKTVPVIPFCEGPFTLACLVRGLNDMYKIMIRKPDEAASILLQSTTLITRYMEALLKNGADTVILLDPNVMGLTAKHFRELILPGYKEMTGRIATPLILHICGDTTRILEDIPSSGFAAFSFDYPSTALEDVVEKLGKTMGVIGSVPTVSHLLNGTREDVIEVSEKMIQGGVDLVAPSCFTPPQTPMENLRAMGEAIDGLS